MYAFSSLILCICYPATCSFNRTSCSYSLCSSNCSIDLSEPLMSIWLDEAPSMSSLTATSFSLPLPLDPAASSPSPPPIAPSTSPALSPHLRLSSDVPAPISAPEFALPFITTLHQSAYQVGKVILIVSWVLTAVSCSFRCWMAACCCGLCSRARE
jgi:hypothetical protein